MAADPVSDVPLGCVTYVPGPASALAEMIEPGEAQIRMLAVAPAAQGRGAGTALAEACIERARGDGGPPALPPLPPGDGGCAADLRAPRVRARSVARLAVRAGRPPAGVRAGALRARSGPAIAGLATANRDRGLRLIANRDRVHGDPRTDHGAGHVLLREMGGPHAPLSTNPAAADRAARSNAAADREPRSAPCRRRRRAASGGRDPGRRPRLYSPCVAHQCATVTSSRAKCTPGSARAVVISRSSIAIRDPRPMHSGWSTNVITPSGSLACA